MRIVMIGPFGLKPKGTMAVRALPIAQALVARGHRVTLLLPPWSHPADNGRVFDSNGVAVENIALPPRLPGLFHYRVTQRLVARALALKPDIVHCFKPKAYAGLSAWWVWQLKRLRLCRARLIVDSDDWEGAGGWNDRENYSRMQRRFFAWQESWGLRHCDGLTVASRALESIAWSMGVSPAKVSYIPNGSMLRVEDLQPKQRAVAPGPPTLLLYTRFFEFKIDRVCAVFEQVARAVPDVKLRVIGRGLFGEERALLDRARVAGWGDRLEYAGWIESEQLPAALAQADAAIYPFDDTLLNRTKCAVKLVDLLAAGVPVVADAVGQNIEYIRHGETGVLVPAEDAPAMVRAIIALLADRTRARALGDAAARDVRSRFGWEHLAERAEAAYTRAQAAGR